MKLGFIGCGKMGTALFKGVLQAGAFAPEEILVSDYSSEAVNSAAAQCHVQPFFDNDELAGAADVILLCVKPTEVLPVLETIHNNLIGKLVISIAAGIPIKSLQQIARESRLVRVMPNTPALIHKGAAAYALGENATNDDAIIVEKIFASVGKVFQVKEELLDVVTGLSGSGPAYVYVMIEALADAGTSMGLPWDLALQLSAQTVMGAAEMVLQTSMHPTQLKEMVTSPGGTTIAGLKALEDAGIRTALHRAVQAATARSRELGQ